MSRRLVMMMFGAALALLAIWFFLLWSPQGSRLEKANERRDAARTENETLELRLARLQAAQEQAPALSAAVDKLRRAIPDSPDLAQFILDANQAAVDAGVDFLSISPSPPRPAVGAGPAEINLSISVTGTYSDLLDYLERIDRLPRVVVIDTLALTPGDERTGMSATISARMFVTAAQPVAAAPGSPGAGGTTTTTVAGSGATTTSSTAPGTSGTPTTTAVSNG